MTCVNYAINLIPLENLIICLNFISDFLKNTLHQKIYLSQLIKMKPSNRNKFILICTIDRKHTSYIIYKLLNEITWSIFFSLSDAFCQKTGPSYQRLVIL